MDLLTCNDVSDSQILSIFQDANAIRQVDQAKREGLNANWNSGCEGKILATLFFEPSTRTRLSFESAMLRLGGKYISVSGPEASSTSKGETISDTIRVVSTYAEILVVRSSEPIQKWLDQDNRYLRGPIINAGDGTWNHPSQALLDAYTIWRNYRTPNPIVDNLKIGIVGDMAKSRTIHSFVELMGRGSKNEFTFYDSTEQNFSPAIKGEQLNIQGVATKAEFMERLSSFDVLYTNRIQKERWDDKDFKPFVLDEATWSQMNRNCIVLNPGPRREELPEMFDNERQNKIWAQVRNGLYLRMALIRKALTA
jgi:aspartate carbamoyltransferase catalytic subunit